MQIFIKTLTGKRPSLDVDPADTVDTVKAKISEKEGIRPEVQHLLLFDGKPLEGRYTMLEYNVQDESTLFLVPSSMRLTVKMISGRTFQLDLPPSETVASLKLRIEDAMRQEGTENVVPVSQQRLIAAGRQLEDSKSLVDYGIQGSEATLHLVGAPRRNMDTAPVTVKMLTGKTIPLHIACSDTIGSVKERISSEGSRLHGEDLPPDKQRLIFSGKQLEDDKTVEQYDIKPGAVLHLVLRLTQAVGGAMAATLGKCEALGACGLRNLGNTCFMNSTLQALSNTVPLRNYYKSGDFKEHVSTAPLGMSGRLASSFAELLRLMWAGTHTVFAPSELKQLIAERRPEFGGYQQHDAQEVLTFLLDGLHEDVNKAPYPRPIVEDPCTNDKSDIQIATEAWLGNLKRNNSKIVDIFQFQVRSEVQFPDADDRSLKFEPMMYLTLPVPKPPHAMTVTVLPFEYPEKPPVRRTVQIAKDRTFADLADKLYEGESTASSSSTLPRQSRRIVFGELCLNRLTKLMSNDQRLEEVRSYQDIWAFEVAVGDAASAVDPDEVIEFGVAHRRKRNRASYSGAQEYYTCFAPPLIFPFVRGATTATEVAAMARRAVERLAPHGDLQVLLTTAGSSDCSEGSQLAETDEPYRAVDGEVLCINVLPPAGDAQGTLEASDLSVPDVVAEAAGCAGPVPAFRASLQDCLEVFTRREELAEEDRVRCEKTGNVERSLKKLDLWTAPECLIIHLKRFGSDHAYGPLEKVDTFVQASLDLDLTPWVLGPSDEKECQYRLYAVVNHSGTLRYGHYTAYGRVGEGPDRQWFLFNDSTVSKADESQVVSQEAYILFYERVREAPDMQAAEGAASSSA